MDDGLGAAVPSTLQKLMKSARKTIALAISALALLNGLSCPAATLLVWQESLDPTPPYATWATAAHVIQDAIDAGSAGDEVVVTNGVYATGGRLFYGFAGGKTTNRVSIEKPLHVRSVNGPHFTVIEGVRTNVNGVSCAYLTNGASLLSVRHGAGAGRPLRTAVSRRKRPEGSSSGSVPA